MKKFIALALSAVMAVSLAACGGGGGGGTASSGGSGDSVKITVGIVGEI